MREEGMLQELKLKKKKYEENVVLNRLILPSDCKIFMK